MDVIRRQLSLSDPFISENGGGIFFPKESFNNPPDQATLDGDYWIWPIGLPYDQLVKGLHEIRKELGWDIQGVSDMTAEEVSRLTGLDMENSRLAIRREFDEPFIILDPQRPDIKALVRAAGKRGLTVQTGGRFYHLCGKIDKGSAMEKLLSWYKGLMRETISIALGDSPNDFPMLERADYPVLVRSRVDFSRLRIKIPRLRITREKGPEGWNAAVLNILGKNEETYHV
jgi:mannosyl-3-phosphoglycerate phosphatase